MDRLAYARMLIVAAKGLGFKRIIVSAAGESSLVDREPQGIETVFVHGSLPRETGPASNSPSR